jgi:dephospho-CoA kinase
MAPLLIEAGVTDRVDTVWVVTVRPEVQLERLMQRDGISSKQALHMINSQMPLAEKERHGSVIIDSSGSKADTWNALEAAWAKETESVNE